jgi:hypothetical protein
MQRVTDQPTPRALFDGLERRVQYVENLIDTYLHSPWWKRVWFVWMGWPADAIASQPRKRWWRR